MDSPPGPGRPRSEAARQAILTAALELAQQDGYQAVTIKGIAERAGVGRQTVYRWWQTKAEVLLEAATEFVAAHAQPGPSGDAFADVRAFLRATLAQSQPLGPVIAGLMADAMADPGFSARVRDRLLTRRRTALRGLLEAGQASGQLPAGYPVNLAIDLVFGVLTYRILAGDGDGAAESGGAESGGAADASLAGDGGDAADLADEIIGALRRLGSREGAGPA